MEEGEVSLSSRQGPQEDAWQSPECVGEWSVARGDMSFGVRETWVWNPPSSLT